MSGFLSNVLNKWPDLGFTDFGSLRRTASHFTADAGCESIILRLLINWTSNLEAEDNDGKTLLEVASDERTKRLLVNPGAVWREKNAQF